MMKKVKRKEARKVALPADKTLKQLADKNKQQAQPVMLRSKRENLVSSASYTA